MEIFKPADILLPDVPDMTAWSVVACDQFTSEPDYWARVYERAGDKPSAVRMILPEAELGRKDPDAESEKIYNTMQSYLSCGVFAEYKNSFIYLERTLHSGAVRRGLVGMLDLEAYDWKDGVYPPIRATEATVEDRLPPRVTVREKALLEMPHIMIFADDPEDTVFSSVKKGSKVYDFELMENGGHLEGFIVSDNAAVMDAFVALASSERLTERYGSDQNPIILAVGDGNHSIAAAKKVWEQIKPTVPEEMRDTHPARYALAEIVNIHDASIVFEPIHRVLFATDPKQFIEKAKEHFRGKTGSGKPIRLITSDTSEELTVSGLTIGELIGSCEDFCKKYIAQFGGRIDYIHGDEECRSFAQNEGCAGILLPKMEKSELFTSVMQSGPFPKKSFSIGLGPDKRYYLECRRLKNIE